MRAIAAPVGFLVLVSFLLVASAKSQDSSAGERHGLGALTPTKDQIKRFAKYQAPARRAALPAKADLSTYMPPAGDQHTMGSCVAWSTGYGLRAYYLAKINKVDVTKPENVPSPAFIFNQGSAVEQSSAACSERGMLISTALEILRAGVVSLAEMPYIDKTCGPPPDLEMQTRAKEFRIDGWSFIDPESVGDIKGAIANGDVVAFGMKVSGTDLSKFNLKAKGGAVYSRDPKVNTEGSHAQVLIGYDDERQAFRVQNSWGQNWADQGRYWLSYDTFKRDANDAYVVRAGTGR
jgi:C1A family cysteine protease